MPLAGAVLLLWRWVADDQRLQNVLEQRRGRCYEKIISFAMMVRLLVVPIKALRRPSNQTN